LVQDTIGSVVRYKRTLLIALLGQSWSSSTKLPRQLSCIAIGKLQQFLL